MFELAPGSGNAARPAPRSKAPSHPRLPPAPPCPPPQSVVFYDSRGEFAGVRRPGSGKPISVEGLEISVEGVLAGTGLELKHDPGVPFAYAGFGGGCPTEVSRQGRGI